MNALTRELTGELTDYDKELFWFVMDNIPLSDRKFSEIDNGVSYMGSRIWPPLTVKEIQDGLR